METERGGEKEGSIHLKVGFGGLADLEFLVQGCQLIYGHDIRSLQGRNTLEMLPAALELLGIQQEARDFAFKAFVTLRSLERRLHLMTNDSQSKLSPQALTLLGKLGLWPFPERSGVFPVSSWEEVLTIRRRIRQIWESVCSDSFSKDGSSHDDHLE
jgi:glutamate-ammonia-ligase adenylyltransferase